MFAAWSWIKCAVFSTVSYGHLAYSRRFASLFEVSLPWKWAAFPCINMRRCQGPRVSVDARGTAGAPQAAATSPILAVEHLRGTSLRSHPVCLSNGFGSRCLVAGNICKYCKSSIPDVYIILIDGSNRFRRFKVYSCFRSKFLCCLILTPVMLISMMLTSLYMCGKEIQYVIRGLSERS